MGTLIIDYLFGGLAQRQNVIIWVEQHGVYYKSDCNYEKTPDSFNWHWAHRSLHHLTAVIQILSISVAQNESAGLWKCLWPCCFNIQSGSVKKKKFNQF